MARNRIVNRVVAVLTAAIVVTGLLPAGAAGQAAPLPDLGDAAFAAVWARTDYPVVDGRVQRTLYYGVGLLLGGREAYAGAPGGARQVAYLDKARLELADPARGSVTAGLLAKELISGKMQVGDDEFRADAPAAVPVAGDPGAADAPTYASFLPVSSIEAGVNRAPVRTGQTVTEVLTAAGGVGADPGLARYGVTLAEHRAELGHNIPAVFADFFKARGPVATVTPQGVAYGEDQLIDWVAVMGLPLAEPYWAVVPVGGVKRWVLMQPYERRVVTYTPDNAAAFRVELGNIGQHYKSWRHPDGTLAERPPADAAPPTEPVPAGKDARVTPEAGTVGTAFRFSAWGFTPNEAISFWLTTPDGAAFGTPQPLALRHDGTIEFELRAAAAMGEQPGLWAITFHGDRSNKESIAYFRVTKPAPLAGPAGGQLDGAWSGVTAQGQPITLTIANGALAALEFKAATPRRCLWTVRSRPDPPTPIVDGALAYDFRTEHGAYNVRARFSAAAVDGTLAFEFSGGDVPGACRGGGETTWSATKS